ncbi:MAG: site-2 protease family protein [Clostridiales bacterium]|nr:site-2 protease family protein [Candidatus Coliplasma equi]
MLDVLITLLVTVFVFGLLIAIHEFGHYLVARAFGVGIIEFSIGMGPKLWTKKGKYNDFSIRAVPIGGFVNMVGEYDENIPEEHAYKIPLNSKPVWKRMLIVLAGPFMNIFLALVIMFILTVTGRAMGTTVVADFPENSASEKSGLMINDEIIAVNGRKVHCYTDMSYLITAKGVEPIDITVLRDGNEVNIEKISFGIETDKGVQFGVMDFYVYAKEKTFGNVMYETFWQTYSTVYMTVDSLIDTFKGRYGFEAVGGPIAVGGQIGEVIDQSETFVDAVQYLATLTMLISVSLGICNLLPIPVLDGGRFLLYVIEAIRRKPLPAGVEQTISAIFTIILFALMILIAFKDILGLM